MNIPKEIRGSRTERPSQRGMITVVFIALLAIMMVLLMVESSAVLWLHREIKLQEHRVALLPSAVYLLAKRGHQVIVERSAEGEYTTTVSPPRPGDGAHEELDAIPVPTFIDTTPPELATAAGVRRVIR